MLEFFRKHQKSFFLVIAVMVISSFVFFGTFSTAMNGPAREDRVVGKAIDGSKMGLIELQNLSRFLAVDREDIGAVGQHAPPNLLNDGVIRRDFLRTGVAETIVRESWDVLEKGMTEKLTRIKNYRAYEHPQAPFISAQAVWERFAPAVNREWSELKSTVGVDADLFSHINRLYYMQNALPAEWMRRILMMTQQQYKWLQPDGRLQNEDFSMFGFHTLSDWFGRDFVDLMAQFIHNSALAAEEKGYVVTLEEAKADLKKNYLESMKKLQEAKVPVQLSYKDQLRVLGMDESEAAHAWRKVLLFRRYFNDVGEAAFIDRLPYSEFAAVATEKATVDLYQWPQSLKFTTAVDLLGFQTYLKSVMVAEKEDPLALPSTYLPIDETAAKAPELVATQYTAQVAAIDKRETALNAPLKEVWQYETSDAAWKMLGKEFPFIQKWVGKNGEERFQALETLDVANRTKVDQFARRQLLNAHPEWIDAALCKAESKERKLTLSAGEIQMSHVEDTRKLGQLFEQILQKPEEALSQLQHFDSGEAVFRFDNIAKISDRKIKTFEESKKDGSLARLVDRALESSFAKYKAKLPADKQAQSWSDAKEELAELMLSDLKKQVLKLAPKEELPFASLRLLAPAKQALAAIQEGKNEWVKTEGEDPLLSQFKLEKIEKEIPRTAQEDWMTKEAFVLMPKKWSQVHVAPDGAVHFMYIKERKTVQEPILEQLSFGKEMLVSDVQRILAEKLIAKMKGNKAIVIPVQTEQE